MVELAGALGLLADQHEVVHANSLHNEKLARAIRLAVHVVRRLRRYRAALARQEPVNAAGRARLDQTIGPSRQTKLSLISLW